MPVSTSDITLLIVSLTVIFLVAGCFLLLYIRLFNKKKLRHAEEKMEMELRFEKETLQIRMEVQEHTLQTIASEIHDNIGQLLSIARLTLSSVTSFTDNRTRDKVESTMELLDRSVKELRQLAGILNANNLLAGGLEVAIGQVTESLKKSNTCDVVYTVPSESFMPTLDSKVEMTAFRIFQEIINNAVKHSKANSIKVEVSAKNDMIMITVHDDGHGFDVDKQFSKPGGLGLQNIRKRAEMIGGTVTINSSASGTTVQLLFPVIKMEVL